MDTMASLRRQIGRVIFSAPPGLKLQEIVQRIMRGPRTATILANGRPFQCWTSEKYFWLGDHYESDLQAIIKQDLSGDAIFYDVGAHAGFWPALLAGRCAHIFAFETSPVNYKRLCSNLTPFVNVTPVNAAVSERSGTLHFREKGTMSMVIETGGTVVQAICLDEFVAAGNPSPHVVKIDVEGHAAKCLGGMQRVIRMHRPVLFIDVHNGEEEQATKNLPGYTTELLDKARRFPYRIRVAPILAGRSSLR